MTKEGRIQNVSPKVYKGVTYRSTLEANTAEVLDKLGIPFQYEYRKIVLFEGFRCPFQKDKVIAITYKPDFEIGNIMLECKGFETPEWKLKKKLLYKYLMENEPNTIFYQIHDAKKSLINVLDNHWNDFGYMIQVTSKGTKKHPQKRFEFNSIKEAISSLALAGKNLGPILRSLMGETEYIYGYNWKVIRKDKYD